MAVRTDAAGDYLARTANLPGYTSFTIMGWGRVRVDQGSGSYQPILVALDASFNSFGLYWDAGTPHPGELRVFGAVGGVESSGASLASRPAVDDKFCWYVKCSGTGAGLLEAGWRGSDTRTWVTAAATMPSAASAVTEYRLANVIGSYYLNAAHRNVKCWSRVLTADEINVESYFERPMFPASLNFWWPLDSASDTTDRGGLARNPTVGGTLATEDLAVGLWKPSRKVFLSAPSGIALAGTGLVTAVGAGALSTQSALSGNGLAVAVGAAALQTTAALSGSASAGASGLAALQPGGQVLNGSGSSAAGGLGALSTRVPLAGSGVAAASGSAALLAGGSIAGAGSASASGQGALTVRAALAGTGSAQAAGVGALPGSGVSLVGTGAADGRGIGAFSASAALAGQAIATAQGQAALSTRAALAAIGNAQASAQAALKVLVPLLGGGSAGASGTGDLVFGTPPVIPTWPGGGPARVGALVLDRAPQQIGSTTLQREPNTDRIG